jgi:hypothetical protein
MGTVALVVFSLAFSYSAQASSPANQSAATKTLEEAILLAGPSVAGLPIVLAAVPPAEASRGVEAWMLRRQDQTPARIVVYSGSGVFRCASDPDRLDDRQCLLRLASTIIHEAWHCRHGIDEAGAYEAQFAFLIMHGGPSVEITSVRLARQHVLAAQRAIDGGGAIDEDDLQMNRLSLSWFTTDQVHDLSSDDVRATTERFAIHG